jgi:hypothetical protein
MTIMAVVKGTRGAKGMKEAEGTTTMKDMKAAEDMKKGTRKKYRIRATLQLKRGRGGSPKALPGAVMNYAVTSPVSIG